MRIGVMGLGLALWVNMGFAQVILRINRVPANTPDDAVLYVAGSFNNWNPKISL